MIQRLRLLPDHGVVLIEPGGPLSENDFVRLREMVDPWIHAHGFLQGVVIHADKFPGWENFSSLVEHFKFLVGHEPKVRRVAIAVNGLVPAILAKVADFFVQAELREFSYDRRDDAIAWASGADEKEKARIKSDHDAHARWNTIPGV